MPQETSPSSDNPYSVPDFTAPAVNSKLTPGLLKRIAGAIGMQALYPVQAARKAGIHESTFKEWRKQGRLDREAQLETPFTILLDTIEIAENDAEQWLLICAMNAAEKDGRLALELASRRFPERWSRKDRGVVSTSGDTVGEINNFLVAIQNNVVTLQLPPPTDFTQYVQAGGQTPLLGQPTLEVESAFAGATGLVPLGTQGEDGDMWEAMGQE